MQQDRTLGAPKMRRYLASTIYRYHDLPSTQRFQTRNSYRHNTTPSSHTFTKYPDPPPPPTAPTSPQHLHIRTFNIPPIPTGLVKPNPIHSSTHPLIHSPLSSYIAPNQTHIHFTHSTKLLSSHTPHSSLARQLCKTQYLNHVYHPHAFTHQNTRPPSPTPAFPLPSHQHTLSAYTHAHKQQ